LKLVHLHLPLEGPRGDVQEPGRDHEVNQTGETKMPIAPREDQLKTFLENLPPGPVTMLNLLKFKEKAEYADGRETNLSGEEAYALYGAEVIKMIGDGGGRSVFAGTANSLVIGDGELPWDLVLIVEYADLANFQKIMSSPEYQEIAKHREAGLAYQQLVNLTPTPSQNEEK